MSRADQARIKAINAANLKLFEEALAVCHNRTAELARRLGYPATTVYGWGQRGRVPPYHADALRKILRAPRRRDRSRTRAEARAA